jgi:NAD(P)H dehydrogenase (quinone)
MDILDRPLRITIVYYSRYGTVRLLAEGIAAGAHREPGVVTDVVAVEDLPIGELREGEGPDDAQQRRTALLNRLAEADALVVGSPSYFGSMASPLKRLFEDCATAEAPPMHDRTRPWRQHRFRGKVGAAFAASGTPHGGNEQTLLSILTMMMHLGMLAATPGQGLPILQNEAAPYGATAISGADGHRVPDAQELGWARDLGEQVARLARWLADGRAAWEQARYEHGPAPDSSPLPVDPST